MNTVPLEYFFKYGLMKRVENVQLLGNRDKRTI